MKRKCFCLLIIFILVVSLGNSTYLYANNGSKSDNDKDTEYDYFQRDNPNLVIGRNYKMPIFKAGTEARLVIPIENTTNGEAQNIFITPVIGDAKDFPFQIDSMVTRKKISSITGRNTENAIFYLNVRKNAEAKMYPIQLNIEYSSSNGGSFSLTETIYIKIENDYKTPSIKLIDTKIDGGKLLSGTTKTVGLTIKNEGDLDAKGVKARLAGFSRNELLLDSPLDTIDVQTLAAGEVRTIYFNVVSSPDLEDGTYSLDLILNYKDEYDLEYNTETKLYLPLIGRSAGQTTFNFEELVYPQEAVAPYTDFHISFNLKNTGDEDAKNLKVRVNSGEEILPKSMSVKSIGNLSAGKSVPIEFILFAKDDIESKNYPIEITIEYETGSGSKKEKQTFNQYIGVFIDSNDRESDTPRLMIDRYDYGEEFIKAGEIFPLTISLYNTNRKKDIRNIRISLTSDGDVFSPVGGSNSLYIPEILASERVERTISLRPKIDAAYKTHNIFADIEYEDTKGKTYSTKELIGVPVIQQANLVIGDIITSTENFVGMPIALSLEFYNAGRGLIRNMIISVEGDFDTNEGSLYIGNLEAGDNNYYDTTIIPTSPGLLNGKIIFNYDDEIDQHFTIEKEFSLEIIEQMEPPMPVDFVEPEIPEKTLGKGKVIMIIGVVMILIIGGFIIYKRKRKKKLEEVDIYE